MAENKKSVLLYCDLIHTVEKLSDDNAGLLFKHFLRYVNDKNPDSPSELIDLVFEPIKQQLKRDLKEWEKTCNKNRENVLKRWNKSNTKNTTGKNGKQSHTKNTDTDNDNDTDTDKDIDIDTVKDKYRSFAHLTIFSDEVSKLLDLGYTMTEIDNVLDAIENYKKNKNYTSLYLTARKWLAQEKKENKPTGKMIGLLNNYELAKNL
jgi:hypothetical protein